MFESSSSLDLSLTSVHGVQWLKSNNLITSQFSKFSSTMIQAGYHKHHSICHSSNGCHFFRTTGTAKFSTYLKCWVVLFSKGFPGWQRYYVKCNFEKNVEQVESMGWAAQRLGCAASFSASRSFEMVVSLVCPEPLPVEICGNSGDIEYGQRTPQVLLLRERLGNGGPWAGTNKNWTWVSKQVNSETTLQSYWRLICSRSKRGMYTTTQFEYPVAYIKLYKPYKSLSMNKRVKDIQLYYCLDLKLIKLVWDYNILPSES